MFKKIKVNYGNSREREIRFLNIPVFQYGKKEYDGVEEDYFKIIPLKSLEKIFLKKILGAVDKKYKNIYIFKHNIGEIYVFSMLLNVKISSGNINKTLIITPDKKFLSLYKMLLPEFDVAFIPVSHAELDSLIKKESLKYKKFNVYIPNPDRFINYRKDINNGENRHFLEQIKNDLHIKNIKKELLPITSLVNEKYADSLYKKIEAINLNLEKFVIIFPEARTCASLNNVFWEKICKLYEQNGYDVFINAMKPFLPQYKQCFLTFEELYILSKHAKEVVALRSGIIDLISALYCTKHIIYTSFERQDLNKQPLSAQKIYECYTLKKLPGVNNETCFEYVLKDENDFDFLFEEIKNNHLKSNNISLPERIYSFDIFDTIITRKTASPAGIFSIIQDKLLNDNKYSNITYDLRENFFDIRTRTEGYLRQLYIQQYDEFDITFDCIYDEISKNYGLTENEKELIKNLEISTEIENFLPVGENINRIKLLKSENKKVILISDMYLSSKTIRKILVGIDDIFENIPVYVSSELKVTKRSGKLFEKVKEIENCSFVNWEHFGDNAISDFSSPISLGIQAKKYQFVQQKNIDKNIIELQRNKAEFQKVIGCSKLTGLFNDMNENKVFGSSVLAPVLLPYCKFIINQAIKRGTKTLYFIARDGYILKVITDEIIRLENIDLKTKYIYGSRLAWQTPCLCSENVDFEDIIWVYKHNLYILKDALNLSSNDFDKYFPKEYRIIKNNQQIYNRLICYLKQETDFKDFIIRNNKEKYELLLKYLKQEINFDEKFAFVDLCGSGTTQNMLGGLLKELTRKEIETYFYRMGLCKTKEKYMKRICFSHHDKMRACTELEKLARAPHAQTVGYKNKGGKIIPVLENKTIYSEIEEFSKGCKYFIQMYKKLYGNIDLPDYISYEFLSQLENNLDKDTERMLNIMPFSDFGKENK